MSALPPKNRDWLKFSALAALALGVLCLVASGLTGWWAIDRSVQIVESLPPPPEGPPDAGAYGFLFAYAVLFLGGLTGLLLLILSGILALVRRVRQRRLAEG